MGELVLVLGGSRSGKSSFAEKFVEEQGCPRVIYIATAAAGDGEMLRRIKEHRARRPAHWITVEEEINLKDVVGRYGQGDGILLVDCLTMWLTNLMLRGEDNGNGAEPAINEDYIVHRVEGFIDAVRASKAKVVVVSSEVGMGLVPEYPLGRAFRDLAGQVNQQMARYADLVYFVIAGMAVEMKALAINARS